MSGLTPATSFSITVRARSSAGLGPPSDPVVVQTDSALAAPAAPFDAPEQQPLTETATTSDCTSIELRLPALRGGCGGDQNLTLQASSSGGKQWTTIQRGLVKGSVLVEQLDPYSVTHFRLTAVNSKGESAPGAMSKPLLTDAENSHMLRPPTVQVTSSASFSVSWESSPCRPQLLWEVLVARRNSSGPLQAWSTVAKGVGGTSYVAQSLRCPLGCSFRVKPLDLPGWEQLSEPSPELKSVALPLAPSDAVRLELSLEPSRSPLEEYDVAKLSTYLAADIAAALRIDTMQVVIQEVRGEGKFVVFDLLPDGDPGAKGAHSALQMAQELAAKVSNLQSNLYDGYITRGIDGTPLLLVAQDGSLQELARHHSVRLGSAGKITLGIALVAGALMLICSTSSLLRKLGPKASERPRRDGKGGGNKKRKKHSRALHADELDEFDDEETSLQR